MNKLNTPRDEIKTLIETSKNRREAVSRLKDALTRNGDDTSGYTLQFLIEVATGGDVIGVDSEGLPENPILRRWWIHDGKRVII
jgi:hypothetical protein